MGTNPTRSHSNRPEGLFDDDATASRPRVGPNFTNGGSSWENQSPWNNNAGPRRQPISNVWGNRTLNGVTSSASQSNFPAPNGVDDFSFSRNPTNANEPSFNTFGGNTADGGPWNTATNGFPVGSSASKALAAAPGAPRRPSVPQNQSSQQPQDVLPFSVPSRSTYSEQAPRNNSLGAGLNPMAGTFDLGDAFNSFTLNGNGLSRADSARNVTYEDESVHSPRAEYGNGHGEYFEQPTSASSRNGSQPPSRGDDMQQYNFGYDHSPRFGGGVNNTRHPSSFSQLPARPFTERNGSMQGDSFALPLRVSQDAESESGMFSHRHSIGSNGNLSVYPETAEENELNGHNIDYGSVFKDNGSYGNLGTYHSDRSPQALTNLDAQMLNHHLDYTRAPNGTAMRQSPSISHTHTPPVHNRLYSMGHGQNILTNSQNIEQIHNSLTRYQQSQGRRSSNHPMQHNFTPMQQPQVFTGNNIPAQYPYPPHLQNIIPMSPFLAPNHPYHLVYRPLPHDDRGTQPSGELKLQSNKLAEFKQGLKEGKKYELKYIYGDIVEFCGDQHGSRFIQGKLETANSDEKKRIFDEISNDALTLMKDLFGNYVIQKFFEHGTQSQKTHLARLMKGQVQALSNQMYACRVVQKALEYCLTAERAEIAQELNGDVYGTVNNQNGNHVIQKVIVHLDQKHWQFLITTLRDKFGTLATNSYGCRVIQRLLEHCDEPSKRIIMDELHALGDKLISNEFGNYVAQHILKHGSPDDRACIIAIAKKNLLTLSTQKHASNVVETCFVEGTDEQRREMMQVVMSKNATGPQNIFALVKDQYGNYVIQRMLDTLPREAFDELVAVLRPVADELRKTASGKQLVSVSEKMRGTRFETQQAPDAQPSFAAQPRNSMSSAADSLTEVPALVVDSNSPQSSAVPSANASVIEDDVHTTPTAKKSLAANGVVEIVPETKLPN